MSPPLILGALWVIAGAITATLPMRLQRYPGIPLLIAAPVLLIWIGMVHGFLWVAIGLFAFLVIRGLHRALKLSDPFQQVAAAGLFVLVGEQVLINVAVNLNLIPTKGMTLPFISYGGSSMLAICLTLGLALALTRRRPGAYAQA